MKAAIYCRLSEEDRNKANPSEDSGSIRNQKSMLIGYALEKGWEIHKIYSDDDYTGADRKRPAFNQLLRDAEDGKFQIVLCKTQSRFTRELELVEKYIHGLFPLWGIRFVSIVDNADTENRGNKKSRQINGLVNEWYLEDMSDNIRSVLKNRRENGCHTGAFALYGYRKDPERKGHLLIDEEAAAVVREVFRLFDAGYGKTAIARILNERGIPNPTGYKRQMGLRYRGTDYAGSTLWKYPAVSDMLANEIYIGNMVQGRYGSVSYKTKENRPKPRAEWCIVEGTHEPIIDRDLWDRVQEKIRERRKPFGTGKIGIFAGKVRCGTCGSGMRSVKHASGKHYLQCGTRFVSRESCEGAFIGSDRLERIVLDELRRLTEEYLDRDVLREQVSLSDNAGTKNEAIGNALASARKQMEEYAAAAESLYLDKVRGILSEEEYLRLAARFDEKRKLAEDRAVQAENALRVAETAAAADPDEIPEAWLNPEHLTREMTEYLIETIEVYPRIPGTRNVPVKIHWNF